MIRHILAAALIAGALATPAAAQIDIMPRGLPTRTTSFSSASVIEQRAVGEWRMGNSTLRITENSSGPGVRLYAVSKLPGGTEYVLAGVLTLNAAGELEGNWEHVNGNMGGDRWKLRLAGSYLILDGFFGIPRTYEHQFVRAPASAPASSKFQSWLGEWSLPDGRKLLLSEENGKLVGLVREVQPNGLTATLHSLVFDGRQTTQEVPNDTILGMWQRNGVSAYSGGEARMTIHGSGAAFGGALTGSSVYPVWKGTRATASTQAPPASPPPPVASQPQQPVPSAPGGHSGPAPTPPAPPAPGPVTAGAFKPLNRVDVRFDRLWVARGYPTYQVHAFLTVRNTSATPQYFASGFMTVTLSDADGAGWERSQPFRASGEPAALFNATPVIQPGGELKVRYVFVPEEDTPLTSLTVTEGQARAEFDVGGF